MVNLFKRSMFAIVFVFSFMLFGITNVDAKEIYTPINVTGFSDDVILDGPDWDIDAAIDNNDSKNKGYTFYSENAIQYFNEDADIDIDEAHAGAFPSGQTIITDNGMKYKLQPSTSKNALRLNSDITSGTLVFSDQENYQKIGILATSGGGPATITTEVVYTDGTSINQEFHVYDWWLYHDDNDGASMIYGGLSRVECRDSLQRIFSIESLEFGLYEDTIDVDSTKIIKELHFSFNSESGMVNIFGISGIINEDDIRTVTFNSNGGSTVSSQIVIDGNKVIEPTSPTKTNSTFGGWYIDSSLENKFDFDTIITSDITLYAKWNPLALSYTVTFKDYDGKVIDSQSVDYYTSATAPENPKREGYTFTGWDKSFDNVTENLVVTAQYEINKYTVKFVDEDGTELSSKEYDYGTSANDIEIPTKPTKEATAQYTYEFAGWDKNIVDVKENITYKATYTSIVNKYIVTFKDYDGKVIDSQSVDYYTSAIAPKNPTREGYIFTGWDKSFDNVTEDLVVTAQYEIIPGEVEKQDSEDNANNATLDNTTAELKKLITLSDEEEIAVANGRNLYIFVEVDDISDLVSTTDKKLVENKLDTNSKVGMYLDINLFKQIEGQTKTKIEETNGKVKISFEIPESLRNSNREFYIIRIHNGVATKITPIIKDNILTFETDKFSTYALAYTDIENNTKKEITTSKTTNDSSNPKTGDNIMFYISMLGLSIIGLAGIGIYTKNLINN